MEKRNFDSNDTPNEVLKDLQEKILEYFNIKDRQDLKSGCYINGEVLSIESILDLMEELDEEYDYMF